MKGKKHTPDQITRKLRESETTNGFAIATGVRPTKPRPAMSADGGVERVSRRATTPADSSPTIRWLTPFGLS